MNGLNKKAVSMLEYLMVFIIVIGAFLIMRHYIQSGINGTWANAGQSFGYGRQFDPQKTIECAYDDQSNRWYDHNCFVSLSNKKCSIGDSVCEEGIKSSNYCSVSSCVSLNNGTLSNY